MKFETSSVGRPWSPSQSNPALASVLVQQSYLKNGSLDREDYVLLLERRLQAEVARHEKQELLDLLEESRLRKQYEAELAPLKDLRPWEWPQFLLRNSPSVQSSLWQAVGLENWPRQVPALPDPVAKRALESVGLRHWLSLALPNLRED